jgi:S-methylmethionine-dependent homocysteine/selenocysteine methylase
MSVPTTLPQLDADVFLTDGGIETTLIFDDGLDLPDFAAFVLLDDPAGRAALVRYFERYAEIAVRDRVGIVLESATWRANPDWAARLGYSPERLDEANRAAIRMLADIRSRFETPETPVVISGCIGPRGDGYRADALMTADEAASYHERQARVLAEAGADLLTAITMTYPDEAIGITRAARAAGVPVVIAFTVETDGALPDGSSLGDAITAVDEATDGYPAYYMVNCAHPSHFAHVLDPTRRGPGGCAASAPTPPSGATPSSTRPRSSTRATPRSWRRTTARCVAGCRRSPSSAAAAARTTSTSPRSAPSTRRTRAEGRPDRRLARAARVRRPRRARPRSPRAGRRARCPAPRGRKGALPARGQEPPGEDHRLGADGASFVVEGVGDGQQASGAGPRRAAGGRAVGRRAAQRPRQPWRSRIDTRRSDSAVSSR